MESVNKLLRCAAGFGLVLLGIVGLILPVMPGWVFLVPGLAVLSQEFPWLDRFLKKRLSWIKQKLDLEKKANKPPSSDPAPPAV
ncbi:MAG: PGPGW domain-containing protein [bacterium]